MIFEEDISTKPIKTPLRQPIHKLRLETLAKQIETWKTQVEQTKSMFNQAHRLITRFGGILPTSLFSQTAPQEIIDRWLIKNQGLVPSRSLCALIVSARYLGIYLKPEDIYPDFLGENQIGTRELKKWLRENKEVNSLETQLASLGSIQGLMGD